jgi:hypothetical protein
MDKQNEDELLEKVSELMHDAWMHWSKSICGHILQDRSPMRIRDRILTKHDSWELLWRPYSELSDEMKEHDRVWARKVIEILKSSGVEL